MNLFGSALIKPKYHVEITGLAITTCEQAVKEPKTLYSQPPIRDDSEIVAAASYDPSVGGSSVTVPAQVGATTARSKEDSYATCNSKASFTNVSGLYVVTEQSLVDARGNNLDRGTLTELVEDMDKGTHLRSRLLSSSRQAVERRFDDLTGYTLGNPFVKLGSRQKRRTVANDEPDWDLKSYTPLVTYS